MFSPALSAVAPLYLFLVLASSLTQASSLGGCSLVSDPVEFTTSGLLWWRSQAQTCFHRCSWPGPSLAEVPGLGTVPQRSLGQTYSLRDPRLMPGSLEIPLAYSLSSCSLVPAPMEFAGSGLLQQRSLTQTCFCRCPWSGPTPTEVSGSCLLPQRFQTHTWTRRGPGSDLDFVS